MAQPSPVWLGGVTFTEKMLPAPPVARTTAPARKRVGFPRQIPAAPVTRLFPSWRSFTI